MAYENGEWIMRGLAEDNDNRIKSSSELIEYINKVGFLPLFKNKIDGFSVEEHTSSNHWWTGDEYDPWEWRKDVASSGVIAYGKFFDKRSGFISKEWFPDFANYRRDGYDFDSRWDDELATVRSKRVMDVFLRKDELFSYEIKREAGFGKSGEKNFDGTITDLMMQTYLIIHDFRQKLNKAGAPYGWHIAVYSMPETVWGADFVSSSYSVLPEASKKKIKEFIMNTFCEASEEDVEKMIK